MDFQGTREELDKLLEEAEILKNGPTPEKIQGLIDELRVILTKLRELSDPKNEIHERVCGNREINIACLESELAKSNVKAMKAASKRTKKPAKIKTPA